MVSTSEKQQRAQIFRALSVESRLRIMQLLSRRTLCVGVLSELLGISAGAVSQHLRVLRDAGLIESERRGFYIHYHVAAGAAERCTAAMASLFDSRSEKTRPVRKGKPESCPPDRARKCHGRSRKGASAQRTGCR
ncbi:MAG: metalloregulator ArsR/SmtB family transcription factor [Bacillota bacterium]